MRERKKEKNIFLVKNEETNPHPTIVLTKMATLKDICIYNITVLFTFNNIHEYIYKYS